MAAGFQQKPGRAVVRRPPSAPVAPVAAPPPAVGPQGLPVDPFYDAAAGNANRNLSTTLAGLQYQRGQLGSTYGLGTDAAGNVFDDPSNPYSRAAVLKASYDRAKLGTTTGMAAQGQLYSGALQNAQNENARQNDMGRDSLIRQFQNAQQQIRQGELQAQGTFQDQLGQAGSDRLLRALAARPDPASVPALPVAVKSKAKSKGKK